MHHRVDRQRQSGLRGRRRRSRVLRVMRAGQPAMRSAFVRLRVLEAELHMVQPRGGEGLDLARAAQRAGGDQVAVEAERRRCADQRRRSRRAMGSPPEKWTCSTPSAAASPSTRRQSARSARRRRARAPPGWSNRGSAADSDASAPPAAPAAGQSGGIGETSLVGEILQHRGDVARDQLARRL